MEWDIIQRYFSTQILRPTIHVLGIGDDAALLEVPPGQQVAMSVDSLNAGVHFLENVSAFDLGHKSLAVSISDIAAMGAEPVSTLLSLSMPSADLKWLEAFSQGFLQLAKKFNMDLVGGDLCRGPLSITTVVNGFIPRGCALRRASARVGDRIYVTGTLGDAGLALQMLLSQAENIDPFLLQRLHRPTPRVQAGLALRDVAHSAMDISDGLLTDISKLCATSQVGALLYAEKLPLSAPLRAYGTLREAWTLALAAGDDYELVFTLAPADAQRLATLPIGVAVTEVGEIIAEPSVSVLDEAGCILPMSHLGYEHFKE